MHHRNLTSDQNHQILSFEAADLFARQAIAVTTVDIGRLCWQKDNDTLWMLKSVSPTVWIPAAKNPEYLTESQIDTKVSAAVSSKADMSYVNSQIAASGALVYQGLWNAATNTPTLYSGLGSKGYYYVVGTAGNTDISGNTNWTVGDIIAFNGASWNQIQGASPDVVSVAGRVGAVTLSTADIAGYSEYTLPEASGSVLGGIKVGSGLSISSGVLSASATSIPYDIYGSCFGKPAASQVDIRFVTGRGFMIPANISGGQARAAIAATASAVFDIQKNGVSVATVTFAASGTVGSFSTQSAITFAPGDTFKVVAPATADSTLSDVDIFIPATLS